MSSEISQIPLMTTEQKTACEALKAEWLRTKRLTVVILTGMAVCSFIAVNLLHISSVLTMPEAASVVMLAADLLLLIVMALQDSDFKKKVRSTPELDPQGIDPATKAIWQQADAEYRQLRMKLTGAQAMTVVISMMLNYLLPAALLLGIFAAVFIMPRVFQIDKKVHEYAV